MTEEVTVRRDDLALGLGPQPSGTDGEVFAWLDARNRLRNVLAPPRPTLRDALATAVCQRNHVGLHPDWPICTYGGSAAAAALPVVEAAVSAAADEAWDEALTKALWIVGARRGASQADICDAITAARRPTEGSAT